MLEVEKQFYISSVKCTHSDFATKLSKNLSLGSNILWVRNANIKAMYLIDILERYEAFQDKVRNAQEINFTRINLGQVSVDFTLENVTHNYTGSGTEDDIVLALAASINAYHGKYNAYTSGPSLFIYSYYPNETFNITPNITITSIDDPSLNLLSFSISSLENSLEILLNLWNCITKESFCNIKSKIETILTC